MSSNLPGKSVTLEGSYLKKDLIGTKAGLLPKATAGCTPTVLTITADEMPQSLRRGSTGTVNGVVYHVSTYAYLRGVAEQPARINGKKSYMTDFLKSKQKTKR